MKRGKNEQGLQPNNALVVERTKDETGAQAYARRLLEPQFRHAFTASTFAQKVLGDDPDKPGLMDFVDYVELAAKKGESGDLAFVSQALASQAITLDSMFTEFARRAACNMGEYLDAAERYARLAFKAQASGRATLEALAKIHQPREQIVRHINVNEGAQALIADQFHHHTDGGHDAKTVKQSHATNAARGRPQMPGEDSIGSGVPSASREK